jgi:hypothetical protein
LILLSDRLGTIARLVTGFTLAGLALLALASAVSAASLPTVSVLGLILFTGCYFGLAERTQSDHFRIALTFAFGLVHGFGLATSPRRASAAWAVPGSSSAPFRRNAQISRDPRR